MRVNQPPSAWFGGTPGWTRVDRELVLALQLYEESLCKCGYPWWMGHRPDLAGEGMFGKDYAHCLICEQVEGDTTADGIEPGDRLRIVNHLYEQHSHKRAGVSGGR